ncbi:MBL fold metallo-hydrolase [Dactylosporangium vinaceum]|uniref:MBL fold metallo-hydrolase n=1 Tax=Dactylosporangium vinaceum TaxID=53362 RepID=A0ABV5MSZ7_9ACTN|nr:MBL fold metallo-hydrolase [Dactylosporangium vinaceum]UAB99903.1 MBL fold metallo-hydrolase [Dactylosporangium vinaceum]
MTVGPKTYLRPSAAAQPLIHRWYAWPYLIAPHTGALNLRERILPILRNYLDAPERHAEALANPAFYGGPFVNPGPAGPAGVTALLEATLREGRDRLALADDIDQVQELLDRHATGGSLEPLYAQLPDTLRGCVELVYDNAHRAGCRFFEPLLYRRTASDAQHQVLSFTAAPERDQPFVYGSPVLPRAGRLDVARPFSSPLWDALFAARLDPVDARELAERLELEPDTLPDFTALFTDDAPRPAAAVEPGRVRTRFFGHAAVLVETAGAAVLLDPLIGYADDGHEHFSIADLPARLDAVVISHFHSDHFSLETLLQLRSRTDTILVPRSSGGSLQDPSLRTMLGVLGFRNVQELGELDAVRVAEDVEVVALPFLGEHADLDIRTKMVPLVRAAGRTFLFATDITPLEPRLYDLVRDTYRQLDALFIGLECVGAPLSWLYGPLLRRPAARRDNESRRLKGSDAAQADLLAQRMNAQRVFAYAMGLEPWLKHLTGSEYDPDSEQVRQSRLLVERCARRGVPAELLYIRAEHSWSAVD